ncbi:butyrophilin subfamily 1 member A1-like [Saccopteryx leptura]|uniref:butyrophilin subfamily 1 member A1-like n=1 Tax=Saccopteryx leptura TaxID=249018 RepID=UPI00339CB109
MSLPQQLSVNLNTEVASPTLDLPGHGTQGSSYSYSEAAMSPHASLLPAILSLTEQSAQEKAEQRAQEKGELKKTIAVSEQEKAADRMCAMCCASGAVRRASCVTGSSTVPKKERSKAETEQEKHAGSTDSCADRHKHLQELLCRGANSFVQCGYMGAPREREPSTPAQSLGQRTLPGKELQQEIDRRKAQYKFDWRNLLLYADWRKEEFKAVTVTLDAATAHPALHLSENGRRVTWHERQHDLPHSTQRFESLPCVLGQLFISSGRYYWEVEVGNALSWDLGVCSHNVAKKGTVTMSPENGFWAIRLYSGKYWAVTFPATLLTLGEKPLKVGILLDYEDGDISFFNITDGSHIFSFSKNTFHGILRPLFRLWSLDSGSLSICPGEKK